MLRCVPRPPRSWHERRNTVENAHGTAPTVVPLRADNTAPATFNLEVPTGSSLTLDPATCTLDITHPHTSDAAVSVAAGADLAIAAWTINA